MRVAAGCEGGNRPSQGLHRACMWKARRRRVAARVCRGGPWHALQQRHAMLHAMPAVLSTPRTPLCKGLCVLPLVAVAAREALACVAPCGDGNITLV